MGREGIYYRPALPSKSSARSAASGSQPAPVTPLTPTPVDVDGEILFEDIDSADVSQMTDSSSADLLAEFDRKRKTVRYTPLVAVLGVVLCLASLASGASAWLTGAAIVTLLVALWLAKSRDELVKTVVLFYHLETRESA
jgi:hypothetical protein